ncbi:uncharacterized protein Dvir_GJ12670 [Drosophila virilis]|uniref:Palmitoyltransferase n=1 Tax=Drosophila virilis TaxID=7244 RepID=B4LHH2_DROVI|nr:uncharacterized protein Dvir_GJ12670 [Drosophila virilis]
MTMTEDPNELSLFLHWGPITALIVTLTVTLTTWKWWPPEVTFSTSAHFALFVLLNLLAVYNYVLAVLTGPGLLPRRWQPVHYRETKFLQYCQKCEGYKAPRTHHCRRCDRCVKKMDHHCPWINRCVGWANQAYFVYFLFFYALSNLHAAVVLACGGVRFFYSSYRQARLFHNGSLTRLVHYHFFSLFMCIMSFGLALGIVLCMIKLLFIQLSSILKNMTDIEHWIVQKAKSRRYMHKLKPFVFPYDLGWYANLGQVFNIESQLRSRGIDWPLRKGCDQYALTCEQLAQKADKRNRTRTYKCITPATGHWLPIWSQGLMVTLGAPCTDDPRIRLQSDDLVRVTRIRDYWLFGERVIDKDQGGKVDERKGPIRGWFPSRCAVDITHNQASNGSGDHCAANQPNTTETKRRVGKKGKFGKRNQD